ncbi:MAG: DegT/DnrJ/EryC1/StrS family aminotransferase [Eubacteriaceae bacterium]|nr:DegT/DnrJ/EryC1/StrS family aminotransferase [Eubacteriaceae bacterium]
MDKRKSVVPFLLEHGNSDPVSFHMPGHKGSWLYRENGYGEILDALMECDITEIPGADNLFQTEGIIKETMNRYKELYGVRESYLLINGSSAGLIGAIMTSVPLGGKLVMARNCHKSIYNGLSMIGGSPVYAYPEISEEYGISGQITAEEVARCLKENPDSSAVILPSPNYYGICSDIKAISDVVHRAGKILIVDQAHGAHLKFFDRYAGGYRQMSAENQGADIVINSTHKTLASFTQTAVVNLCTDRVDKYAFEDKLQLIESTSPSYLLMASLDVNAMLLETKGEELIKAWKDNIDWFNSEAEKIPGLRIMKHDLLDYTKINLDMSAYGLDGLELEELLMKEGIFPELTTGNIAMCMTGIGNRRCDFRRLLDALTAIAQSRKPVERREQTGVTLPNKKPELVGVPVDKVRIPVEDGEGRICAFPIIPYPPGIPIVCPGEVIDREILDYVTDLRKRGVNVMGIDDQGRIAVGP